MFLIYRNRGERRYGVNPLSPHPRNAWEFQICTSGKCTLLVRENSSTSEKRITGPMLVISGPDCVHGWGGSVSDRCDVLVFQFDEMEHTLSSIIGEAGHRLLALTDSDLAALQALYDRCAEARESVGFASVASRRIPGQIASVLYRIVGYEIALLCVKRLPAEELFLAPTFGEHKIVQAIAWYKAHLAQAPTIQEVAEAVHISPVHLRRLFHRVRGISPQEALSQVQFERATWLMRDLALPFERIAESCGFGSASAFSTAFKSRFAVSPSSYRDSLQKQKRVNHTAPLLESLIRS